METNNEKKLLPCPFCGGEAEIKQGGRLDLTIRCKSCLIGLRQRTIKYSLDWLRDKLIESWNERLNNR